MLKPGMALLVVLWAYFVTTVLVVVWEGSSKPNTPTTKPPPTLVKAVTAAGGAIVDGDPQVLDVVDGEVEAGGQARRRGAQHRQVGPGRGQPQHDHVTTGR